MDRRVLDSVLAFTTMYSKLQDVVQLDRIVALTYAVARKDVQRWHRTRVTESLRRLRDNSLIVYETRRGRPSLADGGRSVRVGVVVHKESHSLSESIFGALVKPKRAQGADHDKRTTDGFVWTDDEGWVLEVAEESIPDEGPLKSEKAPRVDGESTPTQSERHPAGPPGKTPTVKMFRRDIPRIDEDEKEAIDRLRTVFSAEIVDDVPGQTSRHRKELVRGVGH